ncbi:VMAP-C domain-containing protein [Lentzea cavernae]|uniref:vWA-MoxR associated protein C-terminal domain-containing protein n=1 Tax=Lentzea cavernae TaxID=2020703 RepID=A0ABQ3MMT6_9PSEU|nr:hypothetical protein [Lentzea cavernae]GHH54197.1 hypothetical protein GCM10017774_68780 [Lentzea cavernae]
MAQKFQKLRRTGERQERHEVRVLFPAEPLLHLMIMIEMDSIDESRCLLSLWRQDDPLEWPPARGGLYELSVDELKRRIDDVIVTSESKWSDQAISVVLEFVVARSLLRMSIMGLRKERGSGSPRPRVYDCALALRSLERMRSAHWHRF